MTHPNLPDPMVRLDALAALRPGWNGDRSEPPTTAAIEAARRLVAVIDVIREVAPRLPAQPVPTNDRGVSLVWHEKGWDVEIDVAADGTFDVWARHRHSVRAIVYPPEGTDGS